MGAVTFEVAVLGTGAVASGLVTRLAGAGHAPLVWGRDGAAAQALCERWGGRAGTQLEQLAGAQVVLLCVSDRAIEQVAGQLAGVARDASGCVALHTSGYHGRAPLADLARAGWSVGGLHPLVSMPGDDPRAGAARLEGCLCALFGDGPAVAAGERVSRLLGARPVRIEETARPAYHAAAALAANGLAALLDLALETAGPAAPQAELRDGLAHLCRGVLESVATGGPAGALSGPVTRGDSDVVAGHLELMSRDAREVYAPLVARMLELCGERDIDPEARAAMRALLERT